ncbi:HD domain-containing protein [Rhodohalobacter sp.]|uniref:HD domain-containing protein n=1 Tax=Rhodohalobacter sp. TaxID=1974210 RepID=UPI002ACE2D37|nr:HD domain-containing protein [Rhodohalobacter sp.]MDZ7758237.1 HD domain-containing protein [Rhodohalobacter sp.]
MPEESVYRNFLIDNCSFDAAHDLAHIQRVVKTARELLAEEGGDAEVVDAAAWLHDCVTLPKDHPERSKSSILAGEKAAQFLNSIDFPESKIPHVVHAIEAHSYSGGVESETIEAKIVQDADRLDALGAIGIARCFAVGGKLDQPFYRMEDPFCEHRDPDDSLYTVDHFYKKLFKLPELLNTKSAKKLADDRISFMKMFLSELRKEI